MRRALIFLAVLFLFTAPVLAEDALASFPPVELPEGIDKYLPEGLLDIDEDNFSSVFTVNGVFKILALILSDIFPDVIAAFTLIFGLVVISAVVHALKDTVKNDALKSVLDFVSVLAISAACFAFVEILLTNTEEFLTRMNIFMVSVVPTMAALIAADGGITTSVVFGTVLAGAVSLLEIVCTSFIMPMISALLTLTLSANICAGADISGFSGMLKRLITYLLSAVMAVLTCVLTFQSIIAKSADTAAVKGVKFVLGNAIPVVGGALSDAVTTVAGSLGVVKASAGVIFSVIICVIFAVPLLKLLVWKLMFELLGSLCTACSLKKEGAFFAGICDIVGFLIAVIASVSVFFIIALTAVSFSGGAK